MVNNIGDHSTNKLDDSYLGSGKIIKDAIKLHGKENFKREIIKICENHLIYKKNILLTIILYYQMDII